MLYLLKRSLVTVLLFVFTMLYLLARVFSEQNKKRGLFDGQIW